MGRIGGANFRSLLMQIPELKNILNFYHLSPQKRFGQNFLIDDAVLAKMLDSTSLHSSDLLLEIGPGLGALTALLLEKVSKLIAYEFDSNMVQILRDRFSEALDSQKLTLIHDDILNFQPEIQGLTSGNYKIIGAIPYQITSPLIHHLLSFRAKPSLAVFMVQKEVAHKLSDLAPHSSYLSNFIYPFATCEILEIVQPKSFYPSPKVDSAIIRLDFRDHHFQLDPQKWSRFLHCGFASPRKMIHKAFKKEILEKLSIGSKLRPENLTPENWQDLYESYFPKTNN